MSNGATGTSAAGPAGPYDYRNSWQYDVFGPVGAHQYSPYRYMQGTPLWQQGVRDKAKAAGYFDNPQGSIWGAGGTGGLGGGGYTVSPKPTSNNTFNYPTSQELWDTTYNLQPFQEQRGILGQMATPQAFQQAVNPYMTSLLQSLRGKGMESSSFADRNVANALGSLWQNYQTNMLSGWQNMMGQMPGAMGMWQQPYSTVLGML